MVDDPCADSGSDECQRALAELYHYLDGHLTLERRTIISAHIDLCSPCLQAYSFETELRAVVAQRCRDEVPESLKMRIAEVIRTEILTEIEIVDPDL